ncbi:sensor histidine kinase [Nonomuraea soli]|uniref:histidine kinase n=1 Tax=Nonomuraea soli TaxID=1032476 RepID=A0A7W0HQD0_9ACTN|nr:histidine kinase [Nonomuraea soli]MBA2891773.1 signal transduction histidine kinase [Nonomuraea soli]
MARPATRTFSVAVVLAVLSPVLAAAALVMNAALPAEWRLPGLFTPLSVAGLAFPALGAFLLASRPRLALAWMMCLGGLGGAVYEFFRALMLTTAAAGDLILAGWVRFPAHFGWAASSLLLEVLLPLYSPDGRLPSRRWRWVAWLGVVSIGLELVRQVLRPGPPAKGYPLPARIPNPLEITALGPYDATIWTVAWAGILVAVPLAALSLVVRFRRADPVGRRQIGWPLFALGGYVAFMLVGLVVPALDWVQIVWAAFIPVAMVFSVMRHRLYGIDTVLSRAFVAAGLLVVIAAVYLGVAGVSSLLVSGHDHIAGLVSALLTGAFFQPLRRTLQRAVDRLFYGPVGDPAALVEQLIQEVRRGDPEQALAAVAKVLRKGLAVQRVAVEVSGVRLVSTGTAGEKVGDSPREVPLIWHGEWVGRLLVGSPTPRRFPAAHDERVLAVLVPYVADVAHAVRMAADLQRSRERLVAAREEERRRLRRDLHDGLGRALAGMAAIVSEARCTLKDSPAAADGLLSELRSSMDTVTHDLRDLVHGLRPPALDDLGLAAALRALARPGGPATEMTFAGDLSDLPAVVEVAVYRIVSEALSAVRDHATEVRVSVRREPSALFLVINDDGPPPGSGRASMRERTAELGGICLVTGDRDGGTTVTVTLPLTARTDDWLRN